LSLAFSYAAPISNAQHDLPVVSAVLSIPFVLYYCFVTIQAMQSFDTHNTDSEPPADAVDVGRVEDLASGHCKTIELSAGRELALYNVNGEFYATENFCPHQGAPLAAGILCDHVIECDLHGWQFDVRTGECLTVAEKLETYEVVVEDGVIKILV
jgi:nitrite reductase/ring-hydroxylating ferredoxin subunit